MLAVISTAETVGARAAFQLPPLGTPSRILKTRLYRHFRSSSTRHRGALSSAQDRSSLPYDAESPRQFAPALPELDPDTSTLLRQLYHDAALKSRVDEAIRPAQPPQHDRRRQDRDLDPPNYHYQPGDTYAVVSAKLRRLLVQRQPRALASFLHAASRSADRGDGDGDEAPVAHVLADLPDAVFSELLRCLDPVECFEESGPLFGDVGDVVAAGDVDAGAPRRRHHHDLGAYPSDLDATAGLPLEAAMARQRVPLALAADELGVRAVYRALFDVLVGAAAERERLASTAGQGEEVSGSGGDADYMGGARQQGLTPADFKVLLRVAGAAQTGENGANAVWGMVTASANRTAGATEGSSNLASSSPSYNQHQLADPSLLAEYVAARFTTRPLYYQFDKLRVALSPRELWRLYAGRQGFHGLVHEQRTVRDRSDGALWGLKLGASSAVEEGGAAEGVRPTKAPPRPAAWPLLWEPVDGVAKVLDKALADAGPEPGEELLCEVMVASAQTGGLEYVRRILGEWWNIGMVFEGDEGAASHKRTGSPSNPTDNGPLVSVGPFDASLPAALPIPPDSPRYPTQRLLSALVETFCRRSEIGSAVRLVDHVSAAYAVPVPARVWHELLEWSWVLATARARRWRRIGRADRAVPRDAVRGVWDAMLLQRRHQAAAGELERERHLWAARQEEEGEEAVDGAGEEAEWRDDVDVAANDAPTAEPIPITPQQTQVLARYLATLGGSHLADELVPVLDSLVALHDAQARATAALSRQLEHAVRAGVDVAALLTRQQRALAAVHMTRWWVKKTCKLVMASAYSPRAEDESEGAEPPAGEDGDGENEAPRMSSAATERDAALAATTFIPWFVARFRRFIGGAAVYNVPSGRVELRDMTAHDSGAEPPQQARKGGGAWSPLGSAAGQAVPMAVVEPGAPGLIPARSDETPGATFTPQQRTDLLERIKHYGL